MTDRAHFTANGPAPSPRLLELVAEYQALLHAIQTGVKFEIEWNLNDAHSPKHLRVGVNSALIDSSALARILIKKGILTDEEWFEALVTTCREEKETYERRLSLATGKEVRLS